MGGRHEGKPCASLRGLRAVDDFALQTVVGRHPRSQTRPSGLGSFLLAQVSIEGGRPLGVSRAGRLPEAAGLFAP